MLCTVCSDLFTCSEVTHCNLLSLMCPTALRGAPLSFSLGNISTALSFFFTAQWAERGREEGGDNSDRVKEPLTEAFSETHIIFLRVAPGKKQRVQRIKNAAWDGRKYGHGEGKKGQAQAFKKLKFIPIKWPETERLWGRREWWQWWEDERAENS